jgi:hypothetical protein
MSCTFAWVGGSRVAGFVAEHASSSGRVCGAARIAMIFNVFEFEMSFKTRLYRLRL